MIKGSAFMLLNSSRKNSAKQIGIIAVGCWIFTIIIWGFFNKYPLGKVLVYSTLIALIIFCVLSIFILPLDITADENFIYIIRYFKKYKIAFNEIKMVELYMTSNGRGISPMITITKNTGEEITQSMAIVNDKNTSILLNILRSNNIQVYKGKRNKLKKRD